MRRISSASTSLYKRGYPAFYFGFLGLVLLAVLLKRNPGESRVPFLIGAPALGVFGYVLMRMFAWDLVDEVYDAYEFLVIRNRGQEHRVPLTDIASVTASTLVRPPRVTLRLTGASSSGPLGDEVAFSPDLPSPLAKCEVAEDLSVRVKRARSSSLSRSPLNGSIVRQTG